MGSYELNLKEDNVHEARLKITRLISKKDEILRLLEGLEENTVYVTSDIDPGEKYYVINALDRLEPYFRKKKIKYSEKIIRKRLESWTNDGLFVKEKKDQKDIYFPTVISYFLRYPKAFIIETNFEDYVVMFCLGSLIDKPFEAALNIENISPESLEEYIKFAHKFRDSINPNYRSRINMTPNMTIIELIYMMDRMSYILNTYRAPVLDFFSDRTVTKKLVDLAPVIFPLLDKEAIENIYTQTKISNEYDPAETNN